MDQIGRAEEAEAEWDPEDPELTWAHPATLAVTSFALAMLVMLGASVFRGILYVGPFTSSPDFSSSDGPGDLKTPLVVAAFLSAAFSLLPLLLAVRGLRLLVPRDPSWCAPLLRAAAVLAGLSLLLRLLVAVLALTDDDSSGGLLNYLGYL